MINIDSLSLKHGKIIIRYPKIINHNWAYNLKVLVLIWYIIEKCAIQFNNQIMFCQLHWDMHQYH